MQFPANYETAKKKKKLQETKQSSEQESVVTQLLGLSNGEFEITVNNTLKAPVDKVGNVQGRTSQAVTAQRRNTKERIQ